jgi:hypothetical protein
VNHVVTSPDDMEPTMLTRYTAGDLARRRVISDAAAGMPTPPPQYPLHPYRSARPGVTLLEGDRERDERRRQRAAENVAAWLAHSLNRPATHANSGRTGTSPSSRWVAASLLFASDELVYAVAVGDLGTIASAVLRGALDGPVIHDPRNGRFYALVPSSPPGPSLGLHAERLGLGSYIGVPRVGDDEQTETWSSYWIVPMSAPGRLCNPYRVNSLINAGTKLLQKKAAES